MTLSHWPIEIIILLCSWGCVMVSWCFILLKESVLSFKAHFLFLFEFSLFFDICVFDILELENCFLNVVIWLLLFVLNCFYFWILMRNRILKWRLIILWWTVEDTILLCFGILVVLYLFGWERFISENVSHYFTLITVRYFCVYSSRRQIPFVRWVSRSLLFLPTFHASINRRGHSTFGIHC